MNHGTKIKPLYIFNTKHVYLHRVIKSGVSWRQAQFQLDWRASLTLKRQNNLPRKVTIDIFRFPIN